jgi:hypothetical protein
MSLGPMIAPAPAPAGPPSLASLEPAPACAPGGA